MDLRKKGIIYFFLALLLLLINSCQRDSEFDSNFDPRQNKTTSDIWDFLDPSKYIYNSNYVEIVDGQVQLKVIDQTFSSSDFNNGSYVGILLDDNENLTLYSDTISKHVNTILPSHSSELVGYWRMDVDLRDSSENSNVGTLVNGASIINRQEWIGTGFLELDGNSQSVTIANEEEFDFSGTDPYTISLWFKPNDLSTIDSLINKRSSGIGGSSTDLGYTFFIEDNALNFRILDGSYNQTRSSALITSEDQWYQLVAVVTGSDVELYINGNNETAFSNHSSGLVLNDFPLRIGYDILLDRYTNGKIDELAIWKIALTANEVSSLYQAQSQQFTELSPVWTPRWSSIVGYWKMDGNWSDSSGNENHGTSSGPTFLDNSKVGSSSGFFSSTGGVNIGDSSSLELLSQVSVSCWIKPSSLSSRQTLLGKELSYKLQFNSDSKTINFWTQTDIEGWDNLEIENPLTIDNWTHLVASYDGSLKRIFVNGIDSGVTQSLSGIIIDNDNIFSLGAYNSGSEPMDGQLDDCAVWSKALSASDVSLIYNRQKQKYAGHYDSAVIDMGTSVNWASLNASTPLPFGKEIVTRQSESTIDYFSLDDDLSDELIGYWTLNEKVTDSFSGHDFEEKVSSIYHADENGGIRLGQEGVIGHCVLLDGVDDYIDTNFTKNLGSGTDFTISLWIKNRSFASDSNLITIRNSGGVKVIQVSLLDDGRAKLVFNSGIVINAYGITDSDTDQWYHIVVTADRDGEAIVYVNGIAGTPVNISGVGSLNINSMIIGYNGSEFFSGHVDDLAIWQRTLESRDVQQLYRRSANRIKYQIKSCFDSSCNCKAYNTIPAGSALDCDGDGIANDFDSEDSFLAEFIGPGGDKLTFYSELFNRSPLDLVFNCSENSTDSNIEICASDEIVLSGDSNASSPIFTFANMAVSAEVTNNRYFQYRVIMEAQNNSSCSGEACLPELKSVEVGPTQRYYGGSPVFSPINAINYSSINTINFSENGNCSLSYQVSGDGSKYYYYDGQKWVRAYLEEISQATSAALIEANIRSFPVASGELYFKAFMTSDTSQSCSLDKIEVIKGN